MKSVNLWVALCALCLALASCSKTSKTLEYIPADVDYAVSVNAEKILLNAGCQKDGDAIDLQGPLAKAINLAGDDGGIVRKFMKSGAIDLKAVYVFGSFNGNSFLMAGLNDASKLEDMIKDAGREIQSSDGFKYSSYQGSALFWNDDILISPVTVYGTDRQLKAISEVLDKATDKSLADAGWKADILSDDNAAAFFVSFDQLPKYYRTALMANGNEAAAKLLESTFCGTLSLSDNKAELLCGARDQDGKIVNFGKDIEKYYQKIDADMLKYLNSSDVAVAAAGFKADMPWDEIFKSMGITDNVREIAMVIPYLNSLDGTVMIAGGPLQGISSFSAPSSENFNNYWDVVFAARLKDGMAQQYTEDFKTLVTTIGASSQSTTMCLPYDGDGLQVTIPYGPMLYIKPDGNNLIIASRQVTTSGGSPVKSSMLSGMSQAGVIYLPKNCQLLQQLGIGFGMKLSFGNRDNQGFIELATEDASKPLLEAILSSFM